MNKELENELFGIIKSDKWIIEILKTIRDLELNDCWIGAGFVRNKIWDAKHGKDRSELNDIDVIYFDKLNLDKEHDLGIEFKLKRFYPKLNWSVKNQARMHLRNGHEQYANCNEAISFWPETATSIAIRLSFENQIEYMAPFGLEDLFNLIVMPTPRFDLVAYEKRIERKNWKEKWNKLKIRRDHSI